MIVVGLGEELLVLRDEEIQIVGIGGIQRSADGLRRRRADRRWGKTGVLVRVVRTVDRLDVVGGDLATRHVHERGIALQVRTPGKVALTGKAVQEHRRDVRSLLRVKTLTLDNGGKIEQLISSELDAEPRLD